MGYQPRNPWHQPSERLEECLDRIEAAVNTFGAGSGSASDGRPYHFSKERYFFGKVGVFINFEHEDDGHLRYSVRIEETTIAHRALAVGPTGLIDVSSGLDAAAGDLDAAFDEIIAFLDSSVKVITRDSALPPGLSDAIEEFRRFMAREEHRN